MNAKAGTGQTDPVSVKVPETREIPRVVLYQPDFSRQKPFVERGHNSLRARGSKWAVD